LNTGTCGPLPRRTVAAMQRAQEEELLRGRIAPDHYPELAGALKGVKDAVASNVGCDASELALCRHTTDGMNMAIGGYAWRPGDEIVTSNIEHPSGLLPIFLAKRRFGVEVRVADIGIGDGPTEEIVGAFERQITSRTRMLVVSHIPYTTGTVLPLKEIVAMAHSHGVLVTVDAAQSYGQIPLDLHDLGVDFYAMPGQKWMCGPEGTGVFYARAESREQIEPTVIGPFGVEMESLDYLGGTYVPSKGSAYFDVGSVNLPLLVGQRTSTEWIRDGVGIEWATQRIAALGQYAAEMLAGLEGVRVVTPSERMAGLVAFVVEGIDPEDLMNRLYREHNITLRFVTQSINNPRANRLSAGFYNSEEDLDQLGEAIRRLRQGA
ncbi:MAG: aminotransferase class V-fold PLP-dependent enzyme, partial [Ktedonobacterales bacterium]